MPVTIDNLLDNVRFNAVVVDAATNFNARQSLRFIDRLTLVPADDGEIIASYTERVFAADIVADDQAAAVYGGGQMQFVTNVLPNIKIGQPVPQAMMRRLRRLRDNQGGDADFQAFLRWETRLGENMVQGVREQMNFLAAAMMTDGLNYNRNGVQIVGNWGTPAALKPTPVVLWTNPAATAVTDVLALKNAAASTYGTVFNRMTLPTADFQNMVATTEFQNSVAGAPTILAPIAAGAINMRDPRMLPIASAIFQMEIELEDRTFVRQNPDGTISAAQRPLPLGKVLFSNAGDDRNPATWDFGNAIVDESVAATIVGTPGNFPEGEQAGPFAYYTGNPDLNPPKVVAWAVARGFPRKHNVNATGVLTVR